MVIKRAKVSDSQTIFAIEKQLFASDEYSLNQIQGHLQSENNASFVLDNTGKVIGYILVDVVFDEASILKIAIKKDYQGTGNGKRLLQFLIDYLKKCNIKKVFIEVSSENIAAINLYENAGFSTTRVREFYYKDNSNAIEMVKIL